MIGTIATVFTVSRCSSSGSRDERRRPAPCRPSARASGRRTAASPRSACCARRSRADATSSIARVSLRVFEIERTRRLRSWVEATRRHGRASATLKMPLNFSIAAFRLRDVVGEVARLADRP